MARKYRTMEQRILDQKAQLEKDKQAVLDTVMNRLILAQRLHQKSMVEHGKAVEAAKLATNSLKVLNIDIDEFLQEVENGTLHVLITELIKEEDD